RSGVGNAQWLAVRRHLLADAPHHAGLIETERFVQPRFKRCLSFSLGVLSVDFAAGHLGIGTPIGSRADGRHGLVQGLLMALEKGMAHEKALLTVLRTGSCQLESCK